MAEVLTKQELHALIEKLEQAERLMPASAGICTKCHAIYKNADEMCWCDYESPMFDAR